jgi:hypothetical protein
MPSCGGGAAPDSGVKRHLPEPDAWAERLDGTSSVAGEGYSVESPISGCGHCHATGELGDGASREGSPQRIADHRDEPRKRDASKQRHPFRMVILHGLILHSGDWTTYTSMKLTPE